MANASSPITLPTNPTAALHAATKQYVDTADTLRAPLVSPTFTGTVTAPRVIRTPQTVTYAATVTIDASTGDAFKITATGALTLAAPTNPTDGQMLLLAVLASGAAQTITLASGIQLTTGMVATITPASGKVCYLGLRYSALSSTWVLLAQTVEL